MKMKFKKLLFIGSVVLGGSALTLFLGALIFYLKSPDISKLNSCFETSLYKVNVCPDKPSYVRLNHISHIMKRAIIVSEDGTFYSHSGFDWYELKQSFSTNLKMLKYSRGGSTITQQLAKNAFLSGDKTIFRKLNEAITAYRIERKYSKDIIFEKYLNMVEFGPDIYGIKAASEKYFRKPPSRLHLLEAVWLAHLLPNPKVYYKGIQSGQLSAFSEERVKILLQRLFKYGDISQAQFEFAKSQVNTFPWRHLSSEDFEGFYFDPTEQDQAIEELMKSDEWIEDDDNEAEDSETEILDDTQP